MKIDLKELEALARTANIALPVGNDDPNGNIESADGTFVLYDEGGASNEQAAYVVALLNAGPGLMAMASAPSVKLDAILPEADYPAGGDGMLGEDCWPRGLVEGFATAAVAAERERAACLALQWSNARHPDAGGHALRNYAQALRDCVEVDERDSDYHWSRAAAPQQHAQAAGEVDSRATGNALAALSDVAALAWKWHRDAVKDGFACSEPAQELFELLGWPAAPGQRPAAAPAESLFDRKLSDLTRQGYEVIGRILHKEGQYALFDSSCRWLPKANYQRLMHEQDGSLFAAAPAIQQEGAALDERAAFEVWAEKNPVYASTVSSWAAWQGRAALATLPAQPKPPADAAPAGAVRPWREKFKETYPNFPIERLRPQDRITWLEKHIADLEGAAVQQGSERDAALLAALEQIAAVEGDGSDASYCKEVAQAAIAARVAQQGEKAPGAA